MNKLPDHVLPRRDHSGQGMLNLLDGKLLLCFNDKLKRWEVWRYEPFDVRGPSYAFITRLLADDRRGGYAEPGQWMVDRLKARDSRYAGADEAWKNVKKELDESERAADNAKQKAEDARFTDLNEEVAMDHRLEWQLQADPHYTGRRHLEWDPEPVPFYFSSTTGREQIRKLGRSA